MKNALAHNVQFCSEVALTEAHMISRVSREKRDKICKRVITQADDFNRFHSSG